MPKRLSWAASPFWQWSGCRHRLNRFAKPAWVQSSFLCVLLQRKNHRKLIHPQTLSLLLCGLVNADIRPQIPHKFQMSFPKLFNFSFSSLFWFSARALYHSAILNDTLTKKCRVVKSRNYSRVLTWRTLINTDWFSNNLLTSVYQVCETFTLPGKDLPMRVEADAFFFIYLSEPH